MDKNCSFVPKNVHLVLKTKQNCTFYNQNDIDFLINKYYAILYAITIVINTVIKITERLASENVARNATNTDVYIFSAVLA